MVLPNPAKWTIQGYSKAGDQTGFLIKELRVILDAGIGYQKIPRGIFVGHCHVDHSWFFPLLTGNRSDYRVPVYAPRPAMPSLHHLQNACMHLCDEEEPKLTTDELEERQTYHLIGTDPKIAFTVPWTKDLMVEVFPAYHSVHSVGYGFSTIASKLKEEYVGLSGKEIGKLRKSGAIVTEQVVTRQLLFYGDTNIDALIKHDEWQQYPVVMIECTSLAVQKGMKKSKVTPADAFGRGHIHFDSILPVIREHPDVHFVLIHTGLGIDDVTLLEYRKEFDDTNFEFWINDEKVANASS